MIRAITLLLLCQLAGEAIVRAFALPLPGPVLGMIILFAGLSVKRGPGDDLSGVANTTLKNLSLLFVPAAVGIVQHVGRVREEWLAIGAALLGSTLLAMAVAALTFQFAKRLTGQRDDSRNPQEPRP